MPLYDNYDKYICRQNASTSGVYSLQGKKRTQQSLLNESTKTIAKHQAQKKKNLKASEQNIAALTLVAFSMST